MRSSLKDLPDAKGRNLSICQTFEEPTSKSRGLLRPAMEPGFQILYHIDISSLGLRRLRPALHLLSTGLLPAWDLAVHADELSFRGAFVGKGKLRITQRNSCGYFVAPRHTDKPGKCSCWYGLMQDARCPFFVKCTRL